VVLVQWTVPSGEYGDAYSGAASWGRLQRRTRVAAGGVARRQKRSVVTLTLDGKKLEPKASVSD